MSGVAIRAEGLSKLYQLGRRQRYYTLRDTIAHSFTAPVRWFRNGHKPTVLQTGWDRPHGNPDAQSVWALRDVSFEIKQGEVVGVIGRNGAGKSTLLKMLSRITKPTEGHAEVNGRVGSLLEVGTGFHSELTGRENIYLNGAILGMKKAEISRRFDEIAAFAEVDKFLDTPVKHYSSGMYMRLAFSVAAHLETETLLVDEVLAVGDAAFQRKCLGKMEEEAKEGRTVLFVSHNMRAVQQFCRRTIWIDQGHIAADASSEEAVQAYLKNVSPCETSQNIQASVQQLSPDPTFRLVDVAILQNGDRVSTVLNGDSVEIEFRYDVLNTVSGLRVFFDVCDTDGVILFRSFHDDDAEDVPVLMAGHYVSRATIPPNLLSPTRYELRIHAGIHNVRTLIPEPGIRAPLMVEATGSVNRAYVNDVIRGKLAPRIPWVTEQIRKD